MENLQDMDTEIERISKMYLVEITSGKYTPKGSFIGTSETESEFFINKWMVEKHKDLTENLKSKLVKYWALIEDTIWSGKCGNQQVATVVILSVEKSQCEQYKQNLIRQWQLKVQKMDTFDRLLDLVGTSTASFEMKKMEEEIKLLEIKIKEINKSLEF